MKSKYQKQREATNTFLRLERKKERKKYSLPMTNYFTVVDMHHTKRNMTQNHF